jgi:hypothetical protein
MSKILAYDFSVDSIVSVEAPSGTNPNDLRDLVTAKLLKKIQDEDITFRFENTYDQETGEYDTHEE